MRKAVAYDLRELCYGNCAHVTM